MYWSYLVLAEVAVKKSNKWTSLNSPLTGGCIQRGVLGEMDPYQVELEIVSVKDLRRPRMFSHMYFHWPFPLTPPTSLHVTSNIA